MHLFYKMHSFLLKICFIVMSCGFLIAATETDIGDCHQTFFDEYDTYVPAKQQASAQTDMRELEQKFELPL